MADKKLYNLPPDCFETLKSPGVYKITNKVNNKVYIGSSRNQIRYRLSAHICLLRKGTHHSDYFQKAWNKYGEESFTFEVIETCLVNDTDYLNEREQFWLNFYQSYKEEFGYNMNQKADRKTYTLIQKEEAAKRINPRGYYIHKFYKDPNPELVYNLSEYCRKNKWNRVSVSRVLDGYKNHYKGNYIRYVNESKNKLTWEQLIEHLPKPYIVLEFDLSQENTFSYKAIEVENLTQYAKARNLHPENLYKITNKPEKSAYQRKVFTKDFWETNKNSIEIKCPPKYVKLNNTKKNFKFKYYLTSPEGKIHEVEDLKSFALENNLNHKVLRQVASGHKNHHQNWKCRKEELIK